MKLSTFITLCWPSLAAAVVLDVRQLQCSEDNCFLAVWGDESLPRLIEAVTDCQSYLTTTLIVYPMSVLLSKLFDSNADSCVL